MSRIIAVLLLSLCTIGVWVEENDHWSVDQNGRWFKGDNWPIVGYVVREAPCFVWFRPDGRWAWGAAGQPNYRASVDTCTEWREPWNK